MTIPPFTLNAFRMTSNVAAMTTFLTALGFRLEVSSLQGVGGAPAYVVLRGRSGRVTLHHSEDPTAAGSTQVTVDTDDLDGAVVALTAAGYPATSWDEAFGRAAKAATLRGPLWIASTGPDDNDYGYQRHQVVTPGHVDVELALASTDVRGDRDLLVGLGARVVTLGDAYCCLAFPGGGYVGLSVGQPATEPDLDGGWAAELGLATSESGEAVLAHLRAAGCAAEIADAGYGPIVRTTDPDGQTVAITLQTRGDGGGAAG